MPQSPDFALQIIADVATVLHNGSNNTATLILCAHCSNSVPEANPTARGMIRTARELGNLIEKQSSTCASLSQAVAIKF